ncbi:MAG: hypothetical protein ACFFDS_06145, partial [Candidatus Thorarchaeota archaeon]
MYRKNKYVSVLERYLTFYSNNFDVSIESQLKDSHNTKFWFGIIIPIVLNIFVNAFVLNNVENSTIKIIVAIVTSILVIVSIIISISQRRKKIQNILFDEKNYIEKKERIPLYKIGKKYDLSKNNLFNRVK